MEEIKLNFMREDPKEDAKEYKIETIQDMADVVTENNLDAFLEDCFNPYSNGSYSGRWL